MTTSLTYMPLNAHWTLHAIDCRKAPKSLRDVLQHGIPAEIPGEATLDLLRAGIIDDPFDGDNESKQQWIGDMDWCFTCRFNWHNDGSQRHDLVALGLDTCAHLVLNGVPIAFTNNAFRSYRWDVREQLREGENELTITFLSPVRESERRQAQLGAYPHAYPHAFNQIRKPASSFGWDWGIDVANAGIIHNIGIESWSGARVASVRPIVDVKADGTGVLTTYVDIERADTSNANAINMTVSLNGFETAEQSTTLIDEHTTRGIISTTVRNAHLWWPIGYGKQPLYEATVVIDSSSDQGHEAYDMWNGRIGFRSVRLNTEADEIGRACEIIVNDVPIHARGYNWIPDDAFMSRLDHKTYERSIQDLVDSHSNMVRVWGGGTYETEDFYELCDKYGIMVWQDMMFACAMYPENPGTKAEVEAEIREQIIRLSPHPSLVMWNGSNENYMAYVDWPWFKPGLRDDTECPDQYGRSEKGWGDYYYSELFPTLMKELDPTRIYTPSAPMSFTDHKSPNTDRDGTTHIWDVWNDEDYFRYADYIPRFADEFGYQAPPAWSTLTRAVHDAPLEPFGKQMLVHQKAEFGNEKLAKGMRSHLTPGTFDDDYIDAQGNHSWLIPSDKWENIEDWHWACQLQQAQAIRFGVAHMRSLEPINAGILIWQLNDDWPVISWSAVDYDGHRKPLWYISRECFAPRFASIQRSVSNAARTSRQWAAKRLPYDCLALHIANDTRDSWSGTWVVQRVTLNGQQLAECQYPVDIAAGGHVRIELDAALAAFSSLSDEILIARTTDGSFARIIYNPAEVIDQNLASDPFTATAIPVEEGYLLTVEAHNYVRDLFCMVDKVDSKARVNGGMASLLPGETLQWLIHSDHNVPPEAWTNHRTLRSANDLHEAQIHRELTDIAGMTVK
ncbi:glycoside hydrolase family 2 protein [Bifidobacterium longum]|uniref:glycoside hydrolase family 2 protein n=1 Tax=Bifidobacterium longum TaxID=216816 RepID=UPI0008F839D1|nr:beta-mannosidase [Bifidobacterium longum]OIN61733.1 beta-mannosidase [Bifidobacterium longum subsp. infantis]